MTLLLFQKAYENRFPREVVYKARDVIWKYVSGRKWAPFPDRKTESLCVEAALSLVAKYEYGEYGFMKEFLAEEGFTTRDFYTMEIKLFKGHGWNMCQRSSYEIVCVYNNKSAEFTRDEFAMLDRCFFQGCMQGTLCPIREAQALQRAISKARLKGVKSASGPEAMKEKNRAAWRKVAAFETEDLFPPYYLYLEDGEFKVC